MPRCPPIIGFIARCLSAYLSLILCAIYGTLACLLLRPFNLHFRYGQWTTAKAFKWVCAYTIGVRFVLSEEDEATLNRKRPYVIVANHQTELDILFLGAIWPQYCSVTSKKSLQKIPFLGWFMTLSGAVFIDRVDRTQALKAFEGAAGAMRKLRQSVLIFPEGTRSYSREPMLLPFKKGAFHLAVQAGVDVLPVVSENYSRVLDVKGLKFNGGEIRVKVLPPVSTKGKTAEDVTEMCEKVRGDMLAAMLEMAKDGESRSLAGPRGKEKAHVQ
ncbi:putative 1-acyl-sn-glycerol-3-phosphate acyltransferase [Cyphellophora attinorum]|uniref:1-acyl-sn-glycerol-3-phosphate acyltransferase n=1 Tax=Cyphellophora attinorum TaxID=1664694 RepID=A0A0N0NLR1_9EURO|nr:putative 1-acyl-sn-glycerol-3-phosphate acyltransferase [Phialophora attinorum]KPI39329.1 putative 1-acyl-sn-glycerol-3-phosphate acyltransferase [Phialophora attinorum]